MARFEAAFRRIRGHRRLVVVPGNHDRLTEDAGRRFMPCARVDVRAAPACTSSGSTPPARTTAGSSPPMACSPRRSGRGRLRARLRSGGLSHRPRTAPPPVAPAGRCPLRADLDLFGWPFATELRLGAELLQRIAGRCDLVLHGHRHAPSELLLGADTERPLRVLNAGSTPELGRFRVISSRAGRPGTASWIEVEGDGSLPLAGAPVGVAA